MISSGYTSRRPASGATIAGKRPPHPISRPAPARAATQRTGKVSRWGTSLGVRIPQDAVERLHLKAGESVNFEFADGAITIRRAKPRRKYSEAELLNDITPALYGPDLVPDSVGREIILASAPITPTAVKSCI
jgi:antitoxin MazE